MLTSIHALGVVLAWRNTATVGTASFVSNACANPNSVK